MLLPASASAADRPTPPPAPTFEQPGAEPEKGIAGRTSAAHAERDGAASRVAMKLERDGRLTVTERITARPGQQLTRTVPLRFATGKRSDRVFRVTESEVTGKGSASVRDDTFTVHVNGSATVRYVVSGAVVDRPDHQEMRWQAFSGWDSRFDTVQVSLASPQRPRSVDCVFGPPDSERHCTQAGATTAGFVLAEQSGLAPGDRLNLGVRLPAATVPANVLTARTSAFALNGVTGTWLLGLTGALLLGVLVLWLTRGRDARVRAEQVETLRPIVFDEDGSASFASPDGVLPGQVGTVIDQYVDLVDVTATVLDLAVRNYLWIVQAESDEYGGEADWWIVRRNPADDALTGYERATYEAVLGGTDGVLLSTLAANRVDLTAVRSAMYADVTRRGWLARRPDSERRRWRAAGFALAGLGVLGTVVLALTVGNALIGLGVVLGGLVLAGAARWMPARTRSGSALVRRIAGLQQYLARTEADQLPETDQEMIFSRSLPYALVLGKARQWLDSFADTDTAADGEAGLYWFATHEQAHGQTTNTLTVRELREFAGRFEALVVALDAVFAKSGAVRGGRSR